MFHWFYSLPWEAKAFVYLASGLVLANLLLIIPEKWLQRIGKTRCLSPNWVTTWRMPICWIGFGLYQAEYNFIGYMIVVLGFMLDRIDGAIAEALSRLNDDRYPGHTEVGKWYDPLADKASAIPILIAFGIQEVLCMTVVMVVAVCDVISTILRPPFNVAPSIVRCSAATGIGKFKFFLQLLTLIICMPYDMGWLRDSPFLPNILLGFAAVFGVLSILSRIHTNKSIEEVVDRITSVFQHKAA